jgi:hypothetical protein
VASDEPDRADTAAALFRRLLLSQQEMLREGRETFEKEGCCAIFPEFGKNADWPMLPDYEAVEAIDGPCPISGEVSWDLFEASVLLGWRLFGCPGQLVCDAPVLFMRAILDGNLDPRDPHTGLPSTAAPIDLVWFLKGERRDIDMHWRVWPRDLNELALKYWREPIFTDAELAGDWGKPGNSKKAPTGEHSTVKQRGPSIGTAFKIIAALSHALAETEPAALAKDGAPFVGYARASGDKGIVGHLVKGGHTDLKDSTLRDYLSKALKQP